MLFAGTHPPNKSLFARTPPSNNSFQSCGDMILFPGGVPGNNPLHLDIKICINTEWKKFGNLVWLLVHFRKQWNINENPDKIEYLEKLSPNMFIHQKYSNLPRSDANYTKFPTKHSKSTFKKYYFPSSETFDS